MGESLRFLIVEDEPADAELLVRELERGGLAVAAHRVDTASKLVEALAEPWDVVVTDYRLPGFTGRDAIAIVADHDPDLPVIVISGTITEEAAVRTLRAGARDFITKQNLARLVPAVEREVHDARLRRDRNAAEAARRSSEERLRMATERLPVVMWTTDTDLRSTGAFGGVLRTVGLSEADLTGRPLASLVDGELANVALPAHERALRGESLGYAGEWHGREFECYVEPLRVGAEIEGTIGIALDVTEREAAEEQLRRREREFEALVENAPDVIARFDRELRHTYVNRAVEKATGQAASEFIGRTHADLGTPADRADIWDRALASVFETGCERTIEFSFDGPDGTRAEYQSSLVPERDAEGCVDSVIVVARDITALKGAERALRDSEAHHRALIEGSLDVVTILDCDATIRYETPSVQRLLGYEPGELIGRNAFSFIHADDRDRLIESFTAALREPDAITIVEYRFRHKDGSWRTLESVGRNFLDEPAIAGIVVASRDVSERREQEQRLRASEEQFRSLFDTALDGILILEDSGQVLDANPAACCVLDTARAHLLGRRPADFVAPERRDELKAIAAALEDRGEFAGELELMLHSGEHRSIEFTARANFLPGKHLLVLRDIGDRLAAQERIRTHGAQQAAVAALGERALTAVDLDAVLDDAVTVIAGTLGVEYASVVAVADGEELRVRAVDGWDAGIVGTALPTGRSSQAGYTLTVNEPVVTRLATEERFTVAPVLREHGVETGMSAVVDGGDSAFGVVAAHTAQERTFFPSDVNFLQAVANVLGAAVRRFTAEESLRAAERRYRTLVENLPIVTWAYDLVDGDGTSYVSPQVFGMLGRPGGLWTHEDFLGAVHPDDRARVAAATDPAVEPVARRRLEYRMLHRDGRVVWVHDEAAPVLGEDGEPRAVQGFLVDVTDRKDAEERLRASEEQLAHAQKMEAIGRLAGGVAHDFNNLLLVIRGYAELALGRVNEDSGGTELREILGAADSARTLTGQLLAFSRRQVIQPATLSVNEVVVRTDKMLRRLIGEDVELVLALDPGCGNVHADGGQLEQVIINLAVNARDAMPNGGRLTMETRNAGAEDAEVRIRGARADDYVVLSVRDNGHGMDAATRARIFEPFFTTKQSGHGTGLGLSTVYGIVQQAGGFVSVASEPDRGTTFDVYLPRTTAEASVEADDEDIGGDAPRGRETILLVEDEDRVRVVVAEMLWSLGYDVVAPSTSEEAASLGDASIDVLLTDVVMPGLSGPELAARWTDRRPDLPVLYMSGYADRAVVDHELLSAGANFINKPFSREEIAAKLRHVLATSPVPTSASPA